LPARLCRRLAPEDERRLLFDHGRGTDAERADAAGQGQRVLLYEKLRRLLRQRRLLLRRLQRLQEVVRLQEETCINKHEQEQYTPAG
jgi:hypothetical protein